MSASVNDRAPASGTRASTAGLLRSGSLQVAAGLAVVTVLLMLLLLAGGGTGGLHLASYLPLHAFLETCSIVVCVLVFIVSRAGTGAANRNLTILGTAFLGVALLDFLHAQSYAGMPVLVTPSGPEKAIDFWLAARLLAASALAFAAFSDWERRLDRRAAALAIAVLLVGVGFVGWIVLVHPAWIPRTFVPGVGLTRFKVAAELAIIAVGLVAAEGYRRLALRAAPPGSGSLVDPAALVAATLALSFAEVFLTLYTDVSGLFNVIGHVYKVAGAWFLYRGLVAVNLEEVQTWKELALDAGELGVWSYDIRSGAVDWDSQSARLWGVPRWPQPTIEQLELLVHPDDRELRKATLDRALAAGGSGDYLSEYRVLRATDGSVRTLLSRGKAQFKDGKPFRIIGILRDITERKRADDAIRRSEAKLSGVLSIAADAIISIDTDARITLFNHGAETTFGYLAAEVLGRPLELLLPQRFRTGHAAHVQSFAKSPVVARRMGERGEIVGRHKDGHEFPAEASISQLSIDNERIFTVVLRDISSRKATEEALASANRDLEARVAERTRALEDEMLQREKAQAALFKAQRMEAFGQLTGGIAHDFNNLLTVISGNHELLEPRLQNDRDRSLLHRAQEAAEMGARLTQRLLTFARCRHLEPSVIDLKDMILGMVELLRRSIGEQITLTTNLAPKLGAVRADASEIENAVLNLALNARDAMPNGGTIVIETSECTIETADPADERKLPPGDYIRLSVSDTGTGMAPEVLSHAFEPFFTTKPPGKGTGLGLSSIYGFVQQSGGSVTAYSELGRGTSFNIYLPRVVAEAAQPRSDRREDEIPFGAGQRVLVVEDNPQVREVARQRIEQLGYRIVEAGSGPAAIQVLESDGAQIDLVFSDVVMPGGMTGFDLARWVLEHEPGIKVLLTSGYPDEVARGQDHKLTTVKLLRKPYSRSELARALYAVMVED